MLPFAFLTILGDASAGALGATAMVSMVSIASLVGLRLYMLQG